MLHGSGAQPTSLWPSASLLHSSEGQRDVSPASMKRKAAPSTVLQVACAACSAAAPPATGSLAGL